MATVHGNHTSQVELARARQEAKANYDMLVQRETIAHGLKQVQGEMRNLGHQVSVLRDRLEWLVDSIERSRKSFEAADQSAGRRTDQMIQQTEAMIYWTKRLAFYGLIAVVATFVVGLMNVLATCSSQISTPP